jgi:predicted deacetylase
VAIHDIEPATFARCALMRDWLADHGVDRATLLVIPARDLHPLDRRSPEMVGWLADRRRCGDAIAQHGFMHAHLGPANGVRRLVGDDAEFRGLDERETRQAVDAGWRVLKLAGVEPSGFVAPAYAYTSALRETLAQRFDWWAGLLRLHCARSRRRSTLVPAWRLSAGGPLRRAVTPRIVGAGALLAPETLRLDLRPGDLDHPRHMAFLEQLLSSSGRRRTAITYDELAAA